MAPPPMSFACVCCFLVLRSGHGLAVQSPAESPMQLPEQHHSGRTTSALLFDIGMQYYSEAFNKLAAEAAEMSDSGVEASPPYPFHGLTAAYKSYSNEGVTWNVVLEPKDSCKVVDAVNGDNFCSYKWGQNFSFTGRTGIVKEVWDGHTSVDFSFRFSEKMQKHPMFKSVSQMLKPLHIDCPICGKDCTVKDSLTGEEKVIKPAEPCPVTPRLVEWGGPIALPPFGPMLLMANYFLDFSETAKHDDGSLIYHSEASFHVGPSPMDAKGEMLWLKPTSTIM